MLARRRLIALSAALVLAACAGGPRVNTDFDPRADFSSLRTWTFAYDRPQPGANPLVWTRTRDAIEANLQARGFPRGEPAQFVVGFTLGQRQRIRVDDLGPFYGPGFGRGWQGSWGGAHGWAAPRRTQVRTITEGTLTIDVFDAATREPLWHGLAVHRINASSDQAAINAAVQAVLAEFPPR